MNCLHRIPTLLILLLALCSTVFAEVEAVRGKRYRLTKRHGPWMIMVADIRDVPPEQRKDGGMTALQAADEIVYELRKMGVPAYTYVQDVRFGSVPSLKDTQGIKQARYVAQHESLAVLAGNFETPDDHNAKLILQFLKTSFKPKFLEKETSGAILRGTPGRPSPFNRAQMTINPMRSSTEVRNAKVDPLIKQLNSHVEYGLAKNPGKYSLRVATFKGASVTLLNGQSQDKVRQSFNKVFGKNLDSAGTHAWELTQALRKAKSLGYDQNYEAWVFHDRYESYVTIGSFESRSDPRIAVLAKMFAAKNHRMNGKEVMSAEAFSIPKRPRPGTLPDKSWMFDITPNLVAIPRIR